MTTLAPFTAVLYLQFSSVDLDQPLFQPFPPEVVFQSYVPCEVYEVPLVLRNNDRVSAGLCGFNIVLGEESWRSACEMQHVKSRTKCLTLFLLQRRGDVPVILGFLSLVLTMHGWFLTKRSFLGQHPLGHLELLRAAQFLSSSLIVLHLQS